MAILESGRLLADRYLLQDRLGDGGHAEVWKALDGQNGRSVALKFLHLSGAAAEDALPVLQHEARMARLLDHPGVIALHEPEQDGSLVFLPMEFAAGGDASWLRGAPWQRVLPVLLQTARVLEHLHARGVVHRDLKSRNVLFDTLGNVRISDFGTAAHAGSSDAPAAGSPFSASPQQLRDEPATPADDVYGLGALAYELLTRYPPFYPDFDARRVQEEDPVRPVPVHAAPEELLDLIQSMLARDAGRRPLLAEVIDVFQRYSAAGGSVMQDDAVTLVSEVPQVQQPAVAYTAGRWKRGGALWATGLVAVAGIAALVWMPRPVPTTVATNVDESTAAPLRRVADAVVSPPQAGPATAAQPPVPALSPEASLQEALRVGKVALAAMQPQQARAAFQHALLLQADHPEASKGLAAAERLDVQVAGLAEGIRLEARGELSAAADRFRLLLGNDAAFAPARAGLARVELRLREQKLEDLLAAGMEALRLGRIEVAQSAYRQAAEIDPGNARLQEGQQRIAEVLTNQLNADDLASGIRLEDAEDWDAAVAHYRAVLARDPALHFAQDGLARGERRLALDRELRDFLARPERMTTPAVRQAAERTLARGQASVGNSPRLQQQLQQLRTRLQQLEVEVRVAISSDNTTQVILAPLGDLGRFSSRELELPPGHYTLIGRRDGFRDVRHEFEIAPGQAAAMLSVQCTERI